MSKVKLALYSAVVVASACGGAGAGELRPTPLPIIRGRLDSCVETHSWFECHRLVETRQITKRGDNVVTRLTDTLRLATRAGVIDLVDVFAANDSAVGYTYVGEVVRTGHHLVAGHLYEGTAYLLVSPDARRVWVDDLPVFSPDGSRFAVAYFAPSRVQIWVVRSGEFELEWSVEPEDWGPAEIEWDGPAHLVVRRVSMGSLDPEPARAALGPEGWQLIHR